MAKPIANLIFSSTGSPAALLFVTACPFIDDGNHGLPDWRFAFESHYVDFQLYPDGTIEWVPPMGPAPIWTANYNDFKSPGELGAAFAQWFSKTY